MSAFYMNEFRDFLKEKGKDITREECFALYGYATGLYVCHKITVDEYIQIVKEIPVDDKELEAVVL